jgi:16S rRNA C1402 (ribose-2'-O) methylase RsmI
MSGLPADRFTFLGALETVSRRERLRAMARVRHTLICQIASADLVAALSDIRAQLGQRRIALWQGSDIWRGTWSEVPPRPREGICTLVIEGSKEKPIWSENQVRQAARAMRMAGHSPSDTARDIASRSGWARRAVYRLVIQVGLSEREG